MRPRRRPWRWRPSASDGHRRSPSPPRERPLPHPGPSRATAHASPHSPARALARGAYQRPQGIAHTGMGNARMQGQQSQGRTAEGMAILGGARRSQSRRLAAEACHSRRLRGPSVHRCHTPPLNARYGHPRATSIAGLTSPPTTKARNIARCIGQRAYGERGDLLLGL